MPGRFEGMSDAEWELFEGVFPEKARKGSGIPAAHPRKVLNPPLFILAAGRRWRDLPRGGRWASKSAGCRRLKAMAFTMQLQNRCFFQQHTHVHF